MFQSINSAHFLKGLNYYMTILGKPTSLKFHIQEVYRKTKMYEKTGNINYPETLVSMGA